MAKLVKDAEDSLNSIESSLSHNSDSVAKLVKDVEDSLNSIESLHQNGGKGTADHINDLKILHTNGGKGTADHINDLKVLNTNGGKGTADHLNDLKVLSTDGTAQVKIMASEDGTTSGTQKQAHCDSNGNFIISNTQNIGVKVEDLSSTLNSDLANHSRTVAVGVRGRTNITDHTTGIFLKSSTDGELETIKKAKYTSVFPTTGGDNSFGHTNLTTGSVHNNVITIDTDRELKGINYIISLHSILSGASQLSFQGSIDGSSYVTFETKSGFITTDFDQSSGGATHFLMNNDVMVNDGHLYKYYRVQISNSSGSTATVKVGYTILYA